MNYQNGGTSAVIFHQFKFFNKKKILKRDQEKKFNRFTVMFLSLFNYRVLKMYFIFFFFFILSFKYFSFYFFPEQDYIRRYKLFILFLLINFIFFLFIFFSAVQKIFDGCWFSPYQDFINTVIRVLGIKSPVFYIFSPRKKQKKRTWKEGSEGIWFLWF